MKSVTSDIQLRITALWAFSEAFLGGILHAFHVPFSGLILSSFAVLCMVALTLQGYSKGQIIKATILVIIIKALLSPHTPVSAYFAVLLQGAIGELIFLFGIPSVFACLLLGIAALMQSAFQKLIILTLIFGVDFWKALDDFLNSINKMMGLESFSYSFYLIVVYLSLHLIAGICIGIFAARLRKIFSASGVEFASLHFQIPDSLSLIPHEKKAKGKFAKPIFWILFLLCGLALYQAYNEKSIAPFIHSQALKLIIRSSLFLLVWYFFLAPLMLMAFQKWLAKQQGKFSKEIDAILKLIPEMKYISERCWVLTKNAKGFYRISRFIRFTFYMLLAPKNADIRA